MTETLSTRTGAEEVRWDLSELYSSPDDEAIGRDLAEALDFARVFESTYKGRIRGLSPSDFAEMMERLERHYISSSKPGLCAHLLHAQDTRDHATGRLISRVREAAAERGRHMVFFSLEVAQLTDEEAARLYEDPLAPLPTRR
jgi:oligoendopeptidase F